MSADELDRIRDDLAVMRKAMGLHPPFGWGTLALGLLLTAMAAGAAVVSLLAEGDLPQLALLAAILTLGSVGLFLRSRRTPDLDTEVAVQVAVSVGIYAAVWVAACAYWMAALAGPAVGAARTAGLYASGVGLLLAWSWLLARSAVRSRGRHYCLGLAASTVLAGMLLPIIDRHYSYALAHGLMAVGYLTGTAIQWNQLRGATTVHAAH